MITGRAKLAGVMGWPIGHSRSPRLHGYWLQHHGIDGAYVPLPVKPEDLADALRALPKLGFRGCNLTIPHKEAALPFMDDCDKAAIAIGAVNTVVVEGERLLGRNTDHIGFMANLKEQAKDWSASSGPATILGAGGAARAVVYALREAGVPEIRIVNRDSTRADALAKAMENRTCRIDVLHWTEADRALKGASLLVNTTSLGMTGQPSLALDLSPLPPHATVSDIVYAPLETDLLKAARARGLVVVEGLGMLLHQAVPGFAAWFGVTPKVTPELIAQIKNG